MVWARNDGTPNTLISSSNAAIVCLFGIRHFILMPVPSEIFVRRGSQSRRAFQWPNETMQPKPVHFILTRRLSCWRLRLAQYGSEKSLSRGFGRVTRQLRAPLLRARGRQAKAQSCQASFLDF